ncbi:solute carrier organic anion transporter family member 2A1 isoform X1 [Brienomyrus brachyistius]|uniref:solute carrier organic anion transporter family member 2A1 isoform X1 n=1 Tax=Brienomyrus brachyistius TaxID=42636 RepID=UPI0020B3F9F6|nr:solute carrier organic anion transporter family member 2A1 isoform X1 [Brienomyrus brachyistius]
MFEMEIHKEKNKAQLNSCFSNIKLFVLCQSLLQFSQLLHSTYLKSCITTLEKRFGLSSQSSGTITSLNEVGNSLLIVFVSYFGRRVHRPRLIGLGGLLMSISAMMLALPHFLSQPHTNNSVLQEKKELCMPRTNFSETSTCGQQDYQQLTDTSIMWKIMAIAQLLFGIGSVPIQPFGISYVDDFAGPRNAPLYIAVLFAVSVFGPAFGFLLGSVMLKIYVNIDKPDPSSLLELNLSDQRWVGAWWLGLLISSGCLAITSLPYFAFPREMQANKAEVDIFTEDSEKPNVTLLEFLKMFPRLFVKLLVNPFFLLLVLAQCSFSSVIAALSTFLNKFLECQYHAPASYSSLLIGTMNLPAVAIGMLLGGVVMKHSNMSLKAIPRFSLAMILISTLLCVPIFFMGCATQRIANVNWNITDHFGEESRSFTTCNLNCSCSSTAFNPVCGTNNVEYISPCHAGCTNFTMDPQNLQIQAYTSCSCVRDGDKLGNTHPGACSNSCSHYLLPFMILISVAGFVASLSHNPVYMMVLRTVPNDEKSFAIGIQFLIMRLLAWLPAPALFGLAIDSTCLRWKWICGNKQGCTYYNNDLFRSRYLGLQVAYKVMGILLLALVGWKVKRTGEYRLQVPFNELL